MTLHHATERSENNVLPLTVDELTTDWLQFAMADVLGSETIEDFSAEIIGIGEGFMDHKIGILRMLNKPFIGRGIPTKHEF